MRTKLLLTPLPAADRRRARYELQADYMVTVRGDGAVLRLLVPRGTTTDFASVPRCLQWLYPPDGPWVEAAVVHDYLYQRGAIGRFFADAVFRQLMQVCGVPAWRAAILYYAVRLFGRKNFCGANP